MHSAAFERPISKAAWGSCSPRQKSKPIAEMEVGFGVGLEPLVHVTVAKVMHGLSTVPNTKPLTH